MQIDAVRDHVDQEHAHEGAEDGASRAEQAGPTQNRRGDGVQLVAGARIGIAQAEARGQQDAGDGGAETADGIDDERGRPDFDTGQAGALIVTAQRVDVPAQSGEVQDHAGDDADRGQHQEEVRDPERHIDAEIGEPGRS